MPGSQADIGLSPPSITQGIFHLYLECLSKPQTLHSQLSSFFSSLTQNNFVFTTPTLLLELIKFVFAVSHVSISFSCQVLKGKEFVLFILLCIIWLAFIFNSLENMKWLKDIIQSTN